VTPIIGADRLWVFMRRTSPKGADLQRGSGYALHSSVADWHGSNGEFLVEGFGRLIEEPALREKATRCAPYDPCDDYVLFELSVERVLQVLYTKKGPQRTKWRLP